jgi:BirA family biotin operon repressor/biotin-[acetyl-CoA-carboxylase] ligase
MSSDLPSPERLTQSLALQLNQFTQTNWVMQTGSTNVDLSSLTHEPMGSSQLLGAHHQTAGRGRAGRVWHNTTGQSLTFSCGFETDLKPLQLNGLSLALGVGACEALRAQCPANQADRIKLKWPNDLMFDDGKLAGILIETHINAKRIRIVVGIGLNLTHAQELSDQLGRPVAALNDFIGTNPETVTALVSQIASSWHEIVFKYAQQGFLTFMPRFTRLDYLANKPVEVLQYQNRLFEGIAQGIDSQGALQVQNEQGLTAITVGDVSVRIQT